MNIILIPVAILGICALIQILSHNALIFSYIVLGIFVIAALLNAQEFVQTHKMQFNLASIPNVIGIFALIAVVAVILAPKKKV